MPRIGEVRAEEAGIDEHHPSDPGRGDTVRFVLNGRDVDVDAHPMRRLLDVLRQELGLTGTKEGCGEGECGACTVLVDGEPVCACLVPLAQVSDAVVTTIEGLDDDHPLLRAFVERGAAQCGICTPGIIMAAVAVGPQPSLDRVRTGLAGNLCRCTGYEAIYRAILKAAAPASAIPAPAASPDASARGAPTGPASPGSASAAPPA